eukprot:1695933-Rhodomonas_salina.3
MISLHALKRVAFADHGALLADAGSKKLAGGARPGATPFQIVGPCPDRKACFQLVTCVRFRRCVSRL